MMRQNKVQELERISGNLSPVEGKGGNPNRDFTRANRLETFLYSASVMRAAAKTTAAKRLSAALCVCLLSACSYLDTDNLTVKPYPDHSATKHFDPACDNYATGGRPLSGERAKWSDHGNYCKSAGLGQKATY
ncbi:hypothetical protein [Neisseria wadsworthii]|nr:hypothetical protein [Neisseria wadsworthii]QMT36699.1 hypothetical protein H3L96_05735 [Neisseria wadsworthii]